jgi:hypothetical protein
MHSNIHSSTKTKLMRVRRRRRRRRRRSRGLYTAIDDASDDTRMTT